MDEKRHPDHRDLLPNENIEALIDKKIADAKLLASEKRLSFTLALGAAILTVFGIIIPILIVFQSSNRVDSSIQRMEERLLLLTEKLSSKVDSYSKEADNRFISLADKSTSRVDASIHKMNESFKELAGRQFRKPRLEFIVDGQPLAGASLIFDSKNDTKYIELKNVGDGTAEQVRLHLYLNKEDNELRRDLGNWGWWKSDVNDRKDFGVMFYNDAKTVIPAKASNSLRLWFQNSLSRKQNFKSRALLKVFYGEPIPAEVPFSLEIRNN